ncbi:MAG TPA: hypothetical protein VGF55_29190 [Gemmataceae bacterium]|jgi:hypothetical protein
MTVQHTAPSFGPVGRAGAALPSITVRCGNPYCGAFGRQARVLLRQVTPGFVEAPRMLLCRSCGYEAETVSGWPPPVVEESMAKITVHGGATNAAADREDAAAEAGAEPAAAAPPVAPAEPALVAEVEETPQTAPAGAPADGGEQPPRPAQADPKAAWLAYAQAIGVDGVEDLNKAQLIHAVKTFERAQAIKPAEGDVVGLTAVAEAEVIGADGSRS